MKVSVILAALVLLLCSQESRGQTFDLGLTSDEALRPWIIAYPGISIDTIYYPSAKGKKAKLKMVRLFTVPLAHRKGLVGIRFDENGRSNAIVWKRGNLDEYAPPGHAMYDAADSARQAVDYIDFRQVKFAIDSIVGYGFQTDNNGNHPYRSTHQGAHREALVEWGSNTDLSVYITPRVSSRKSKKK